VPDANLSLSANCILSIGRYYLLFLAHALRCYTLPLLDQIGLFVHESRLGAFRLGDKTARRAFVYRGGLPSTHNLRLAKLDVIVPAAQAARDARQFVHDLRVLVHLRQGPKPARPPLHTRPL